jgi:hypothetical protein
MISGTVTNINGAPVAGVLLQPGSGVASVTTDTNGNYSIGVPPGWSGTVTPTLGTSIFLPASLAYVNLSGPLTGQNYLTVPTIAPQLGASLGGTNLVMNWAGIPGVTYQPMWSTDLVNWQAYGNLLSGTNGPMQLIVPPGIIPAAFFRLIATP